MTWLKEEQGTGICTAQVPYLLLAKSRGPASCYLVCTLPIILLFALPNPEHFSAVLSFNKIHTRSTIPRTSKPPPIFANELLYFFLAT